MPDALAKTVPIWCVVLNRLLFEDNKAGYKLYFPSGVVGPSERVQIIAKLGSFVADAKVVGSFLDRSYVHRLLTLRLTGSAIKHSFATKYAKQASSSVLGDTGNY